ncbi:alpha/beta hydrolase [Robertkochia solimangrovi]|uniref:alpha/beta hydrolase n=1 Tax=Robertkochia solimangrovi TaxID=2213046 RepID=UPI001180EFBF|nr:alpha/beta hydrolase [Robertkochia solimangrovi]TRZ46101.1 alpha/beta hydrolase [Robertkochia solimangrovi]
MLKIIKGTLLFCFIVIITPVLSQNTEYKEVHELSYRQDGDDYSKQQCLLDISYPVAVEDAPVVVWFHGGGLTGGHREVPEVLTKKGVVVVGVGYRLSPRVEVVDCIDDAAAAVAWVIKNISKYNGDPNKVFVSGHSAGGYLVSMIGFDRSWLQKYGVQADQLAGLIPFSGHTITHFTEREKRGIPGTQAIVDSLAPLYHVRKDAPPTLLITGDRELEMLGRYEENAYFYRMLKVVGHPEVDIMEMQGYDHGMTYPAFPILLKFIKNGL